MSYNNYLLNLANISNEIGYSLTYGYGDIAATEINFLKTLIAKSEEMIPILEAEACFYEAEELDREEQYFNNWMTMLYGGNNSVSPVDTHNINKANHLKRRKANKKHHDSDRRHGKTVPQSDKKYWDEQSGTFYRWDEKKKTFNSHKKPKVHRNRKTFRDRLEVAMEAREQDYILSPDPIEELWNAYWLYCDAECRLNHKADEPLFMHRTQGAYEEAIKEWEKLTEEEYNTFLEVDSLLYSLGLDWNYFD